jgi:hypothetical protein
MSHAVLHSTGPWLLRDAFKAFTGEQGQLAAGYAGEHTVEDTHIMVYALGQWCVPLPARPSWHLVNVALHKPERCAASVGERPLAVRSAFACCVQHRHDTRKGLGPAGKISMQ